MTLIQAIILGIVEGITEFLPISSTGHMILVGTLLRIPQTEFLKTFEIVIQLGAIIAVGFLYIKTLLTKRVVWFPLIAAFIPTSIIGFIMYKFVKQFLLGNSMITVIALGLGGIAFYAIEQILKRHTPKATTLEKITIPQAILIGVGQSVSIIPGVSRAAASIFTGMLIGLSRQTAVEFSFLLAIPTMIAFILPVIIGTLVAFVTAMVTVKLFLKYVQSHTFFPFAIYRIFLAIGFWYFILRS
ncbi:MAG: Undecaprenyl-diphosphatase [Candidatus Roizmanbacteria bacterium GW2011_GWC2_41_7]|uniref:Undecaprenyl-diphosphatase n=1 Tax=Candidatus Roizmanbacteria bacterium GW2011_GWC2_41_7 TaxID=1618487 RepID=A0A0G1A1F8_9BACT|nr:MAG: Undecaprenyl-diphosphatase [Candidatus Roizmanbacteria bacterium GW2011_GWC2_41_7]